MTAETILSLINSDQVTDPTRVALENRLAEKIQPVFFSDEEFDLLESICDHLLAQTENPIVDIAGLIDKRLAAKSGPGWRYDKLPPDGISYKTGLKAISASMLLLAPKFNDLSPEEKNNLLKTVQQGNVQGEAWADFSADSFFEMMLTEATEHFYSHPSAQAEINYTGFADANGWQVPQLKPNI